MAPDNHTVAWNLDLSSWSKDMDTAEKQAEKTLDRISDSVIQSMGPMGELLKLSQSLTKEFKKTTDTLTLLDKSLEKISSTFSDLGETLSKQGKHLDQMIEKLDEVKASVASVGQKSALATLGGFGYDAVMGVSTGVASTIAYNKWTTWKQKPKAPKPEDFDSLPSQISSSPRSNSASKPAIPSDKGPSKFARALSAVNRVAKGLGGWVVSLSSKIPLLGNRLSRTAKSADDSGKAMDNSGKKAWSWGKKAGLAAILGTALSVGFGAISAFAGDLSGSMDGASQSTSALDSVFSALSGTFDLVMPLIMSGLPVWGMLKGGISGVGTAVMGMGKVFMGNPIFRAVALLAMGAGLIIANWDKVSGFFSDLWAKIASMLPKWARKLLGIEEGELTMDASVNASATESASQPDFDTPDEAKAYAEAMETMQADPDAYAKSMGYNIADYSATSGLGSHASPAMMSAYPAMGPSSTEQTVTNTVNMGGVTVIAKGADAQEVARVLERMQSNALVGNFNDGIKSV